MMLKFLKISISALALSAFVVAPAVTFVTADSAYAKSDNAGGKGNDGGNRGNGGGGKGGGDKGGNGKGSDKGGKGADKGNRGAKKGGNNGNGGGKSASSGSFSKDLKSFGNSIKNDFGSLFGVKKSNPAAAKAAKKSSKPAQAQMAKVKDAMHPSNLGKMNGLMNSSINAKLAHIANGQYATNLNSPVSLGAAVAVAGYQLRTTQAAVDTLAYGDAVTDAQTTLAGLEEQQILDAQEAVKDLTDADIQEAQDIVDGKVEGDVAAAQETLDNKAIADAQATVEQAIDDGAIDPDTGDFTESFAGDVADAENTVADALEGYPEGTDPVAAAEMTLDSAEENALSTYKGDFDSLTEAEQQAVRDAMYGALPQDDQAIADALAKNEAAETEMDVEGDGDDVSTDSTTEDGTDSAMAVDETSEG